ncbi:MAG: hypothetical protein Kow0090_10480 [Myxococcota bacterium]
MFKKIIYVSGFLMAVSGGYAYAQTGFELGDESEKPKPLSEMEKRAIKAAVGDRVNGEKLFKMNCAACHGFNQRGDGVIAQHLNPSPANLRDGKIMNMLSYQNLIETIKKGGARMGKSGSMPPFEYTLSELQLWDLASFLTALYPHVEEFFPEARFYIAKEYQITEHGRKRIEKALNKTLPDDEFKIVVFTAYRKHEYAKEGAVELVPQIPAKLDELKKKDKLGYLMFLDIEVGKSRIPVAVTLDAAGVITRLIVADPTIPDAAKLNAALANFKGKGLRGGAYSISKVAVKDRGAKSYEWGVYKMWLRALEACFVFETEERERSWADDSFGPKKKKEQMPDVEFKVK